MANTTGCGGSCEDDDSGGSNCAVPPTEIQSTGEQPSTGIVEGTSSTTTGDGPADASSSGDDESTGTTTTATTTGEDETSTGVVGSQTWCADADADGFGDPDDCADVPDDERPPSGAVLDDTDCDDGSDRTFPGAASEEAEGECTKDADQDGWGDVDPPEGVEVGTDCLDEDPDTFPGAAELDDASACMRDADDDGYGDTMPPGGGIAGTDCADDDAAVPSASACPTWCADEDEDQFGDPDACVVDDQPPEGYVGNDADCDDTAAEAFPGAAPNDDTEACMLDVDGDDYGDASPDDAAITSGSDCDDLEVLVFDACFDCPAGTFFCNTDDDAAQCNATGTWGTLVEACGFGCDDDAGACWSALTVDAGSCSETTTSTPATLTATTTGGDGAYVYAWTPAASLDVADAATVSATPPDPTTYSVSITDGEANAAADQVTVHITDADWSLQAPGCAGYVYADVFDAPAPDPADSFFTGGTAHCNLVNNSLPNIYVCPQVMEQAQVGFDLEVVNIADDDGIGFVYGWQDPSHFYLVSWKQADEVAPWGTWQQGITVKRIDADDPADITGEDLGASYDTAHGTVLATPAEFFADGWANQVLYRAELQLDGDTTTVTITNQDDGGSLVVEGIVTDATYGPGAVGDYSASQRSVCTGAYTSSCL